MTPNGRRTKKMKSCNCLENAPCSSLLPYVIGHAFGDEN